jgi:hypothetical protein
MIEYPVESRLNINSGADLDVGSHVSFVSTEICQRLYLIRRT